jgi:hypothetical protein
MNELYSLGDRTESCGIPPSIYLGVDIWPTMKTMNCRFERKELISLIKWVEYSNLDNL